MSNLKYVLIIVYSYLIQDDEYFPEGQVPVSAKFAVLSDTPFGLQKLVRVKKYLRACHGQSVFITRSYETTKDERTVRRDFPETWLWEELAEVIDSTIGKEA